jgi:hypothetical protein
MKISTKIRIKVIKRILKRLNYNMKTASPWVGEDYEYYKQIEYWEEIMNNLKYRNH